MIQKKVFKKCIKFYFNKFFNCIKKRPSCWFTNQRKSCLLLQGMPTRDQGPAAGPDTVAPPSSGAPAAPSGGVSAPANTGSSPSPAAGGKWTALIPKSCTKLDIYFRILCQFSSFLLLIVLTCTSSQSLELPEKSATVPGDATADSAESCSSSNVAAGDRQGEPRAAAGEEVPQQKYNEVPQKKPTLFLEGSSNTRPLYF